MRPFFSIVFILALFAILLSCTERGTEANDAASAEVSSTESGSQNASDHKTVDPDQNTPESLRERLENLQVAVLKEKVESEDFELKDLKGAKRKLSNYRGKLVFLNFWATWCGPCRIEMPSMQRLYDELKDEGLVILAIDLQEETKRVRKFVSRYKLTFPILLDQKGEVGALYSARSIPTTYLIDKDGMIFGGAIGAREWDTPQMISVFREILQKGITF